MGIKLNRDQSGKIIDERNLLLGQWQFNALKPKSQDVTLSILIIHHPMNWLLGVVEHYASNFIQQNFDFVLFGHTHTVRELSQRISPAGQCISCLALLLHIRTDRLIRICKRIQYRQI